MSKNIRIIRKTTIFAANPFESQSMKKHFTPKKILQVTNRLPYPLNDGGNIGIYYITKMLAQKGNEVHLLSLNTKKHYHSPKPLESMAKVYTVDIDTTVTGWGVLTGFFYEIPYNIRRFESAEFRNQLINLVKTEDFDIIQLEGVYLALYLEDIRKHCDSKVVLRAHNVENQIWGRLAAQNSNLLKKAYYRHLSKGIEQFEAKNAPKFDGIIPVTEVDAQYFKRHAPQTPLKSVPAGIDFSVYPLPNTAPKSQTLCMLGSLEWQPNVEAVYWMVEEVMPLLLKKKPEVSLHIAGKNPPQSLLDLKAEGMVMHGMVDSAQEFLNTYDILIVPLFSGSGMRLKIVEAMAYGKCIITTSIGVEGIFCEPNKDILIADTVEDMVDMIVRVLEDDELKKNIQQNARIFVEQKYDWEVLIEEFLSFYDSLK